MQREPFVLDTWHNSGGRPMLHSPMMSIRI